MKIRILEPFLDGRDRYEQDDERTVSTESGEYFCACGWAEDLSGNVATAPRQKTGEIRLDVRGANHNQTADEV